MPETMAALRSLPERWQVILNARPTGAHHTREIDALVVTERALHLIEFKYRKGIAHIKSDAEWWFDGYPEKQSPAIQAQQTADAFKTWLKGDGQLRNLQGGVLPWVVLERHDPLHRTGSTPMREDRYYDVGFTKVISGVHRLQDLLLKREKYDHKKLPWNGIDSHDARLLIEHMGAKPLDTLTIQGRVMTLEEGRGLEGIRLLIQSSVTQGPQLGFTCDVTTDEQGQFTVVGAPIGEFQVQVQGTEHLDGWTALPATPIQPQTSFALVTLYLVRPGLTESQIQNLLQTGLQETRRDVSDLQSWMLEQDDQRIQNEERLRLLEERAAQSLEQEAPDLDAVWTELDRLRADQHKLAQLDAADLRQLAADALTPLRTELAAVNTRLDDMTARVGVTERQAAQASQLATTSAQQARTASDASRQAAEEARQSRVVQERRLDHEQTVHNLSEERRSKRTEALKLSAIVGAAGGILSMQPLPFADNVILAPMQIWLVVRIGQMYGQSVTQDAALKLLGTLGFGFAAQHATVAMYKLIPGLTFGLGPFTVFGFTVLLGAMTATFYERGQMPSKAEQKALLNSIKTLLKDKELAADIRQMGTVIAAEFKTRGYKTRAEDLQAVFGKASEQARPIGERLERELFGKDRRPQP